MNSVGQHVADPIERLLRFVEPASAALSTANISTAYASEGGQVAKRFTACPDTADMPARR
jgi:hypothetical protein